MIDRAIPSEIHVGPHRYKVRVESEPFVSDDNQTVLCGEADHNQCLIRIMDRNPDMMFTTLWHEILHAINDFSGTDLSEDVVSRLAPALVMVLIDNGYVSREPS